MITILEDVNIKELPKTFLRCQSFFYSSFREDLLRYVETPAFLQRKKKKIQEEQYENAGLNIKVDIDGDIEPKVGRGKKRLLSRLTRLFDTEEHDANNFFEKGCNCYFGENVQQNYVQAVYWFKRAADLGNASAQFNLGVCYANGQGVAQSYTEAVKWYRKAAEQGDASAQYNLGVCYDNGLGVAQSYAEAVKWYRKAAEQGYADAQRNLGVCYYHGQGVSQNYLEAIEWWRKSAEQGNATAQYNLGSCYDNGKLKLVQKQ